jgi:DNA-binding MarR family transcriptional regulator
MPSEEAEDFLVQENLKALGVSLLSEWDTLAFLYRHGTTLTSAAQIARLLGGDTASVSKALDRLESLELIQRSRGSQDVRLYRFAVLTDPSRQSCLMELMSLAEKRTGRLLLLKHLRRGSPQTVSGSGGLRFA